MVENHGIGWVDGVGTAQLLHPVLDRIRTLIQEFVQHLQLIMFQLRIYSILNTDFKVKMQYLISSERYFLLCISSGRRRARVPTSVADLDPESVPFMTTGSGIRNRFFPDLGSQTHTFESLMTFLWVKSSIILYKLAWSFFLHLLKKIIFNFVIFVASKKGGTTNVFSPFSFVADFWSGIRDGQKSGSGIRD